MYIVSQKNPPPEVIWYIVIFLKKVENFKSIFYTPITRFYLRKITNFYSNISNFDEVLPY